MPAAHDAPTLPMPDSAGAPLTPPAVVSRPSAWRQLAGALGWRAAAPPADSLQAASRALIACLDDLHPLDTLALRQLLGHAHTLAELWHLRPMVYRHLALAYSQAEAERRLAPLNPLFSSLAPGR